MLINDNKAMENDEISVMIATMNGNNPEIEHIATGIYSIGHFGSSVFMPGYENWPDLSINAYGVCDNHEQIIDQCPELMSKDRKFVITLTPVRKANQEPEGGWRWHKWGPYIGIQNSTCEYIYDEPEIDKVFVYHIYEKEAV